jgi:transcriptional regulator with XRE-family HTH domain
MYGLIFFTNVLHLLDDLGVTKNELAERAGLPFPFLLELTDGRSIATLDIMDSIAGALNVPLPPLLEYN